MMNVNIMLIMDNLDLSIFGIYNTLNSPRMHPIIDWIEDYPALSSLVFWNKPHVSGLTLLIGVLTYLLCKFGSWSIISLLSSLITVILITGHAKKRIARMLRGGSISPEQTPEKDEIVPSAEIHNFVNEVSPLINSIARVFWKISTFHDTTLTHKAIGVSFGLFVLGRLFTGLTLSFFAFFTLMTFPKVYVTYPNQVTTIAHLISRHVGTYVDLVYRLALRYLTQAKLKVFHLAEKAGARRVLERFNIVAAPVSVEKEE
ncbi:hypothetical protein P9112_013763 [Eukaryota sp. TZLM1-RC]